MSFIATKYNNSQSWLKNKFVVETVADAATQVSLQAEYNSIASVLGGANGIPAIYRAEDLTLLGGFDFDDLFSIINLKSQKVDTAVKVAYLSGYGAVGDGTTSDRAAFISALTDLALGGTLYVEDPGVSGYRIDDEIKFDAATFPAGIPTNVRIVGLGSWPTIHLDTDAGADDAFDVFGAAGIIFENLSFTGDAAQASGYYIANLGNFGEIRNVRLQTAGSMSGAISQNFSSIVVRPQFKDIMITGTGTVSQMSLAKTRYAVCENIYIDDLAGNLTQSVLDIDSPSPGFGNEELVMRDITIKRQLSAVPCLRVDVNHTERARISGLTILNELAGSKAVECLGDNFIFESGKVFCNGDAAGTDGFDFTGAIDCRVGSMDIVGNDARTGSNLCEGFGIRVTDATNGLILDSVRIIGFDHANGRAVGPNGQTPAGIQFTGCYHELNASGGTQVDVTLTNCNYDRGQGSAATTGVYGNNMEV